jgi:hypothetical protein
VVPDAPTTGLDPRARQSAGARGLWVAGTTLRDELAAFLGSR